MINEKLISTPSILSQALANSLIRIGGYDAHADKNILFQIISIVDEKVKLGHSCVAISEIESTLDINNLSEKIKSFPILIGDETEKKPLVYCNESLAFLNTFLTEKIIIDYKKKQQHLKPINENILCKIDLDGLDIWQKLAVITVNSSSFSMLTGGAGTGKTTTLTKILEWVYEENINSKIILAAPTGKAAKRLQESIHQQAEKLPNLPIFIKENLQKLEVRTIHQILGVSQKTGKAYRSENKPLICDFMAIDESSMVGNHLFVQVIKSILPTTKLLLLGDEQQLPAINTPSFFNILSRMPEQFTADFMAEIMKKTPVKYISEFEKIKSDIMLGDTNQCIIKLKKSFRFNQDSAIYSYANATLQQDLNGLVSELELNQNLHNLENYLEHLWQQISSSKKGIRGYLEHSIILCSKRQGYFSTEQINRFLDAKLLEELKNKESMYSNKININNEFKHKDWYVGRRVIIEENNYSMNVFNGDIGECVLNENNDLVIDFGHTTLQINELPKKYNLAFAISIHKSQGSEYANVAIVLGTQINPLLNKSLLYTAITRAKQEVDIYSSIAVLQYCLRTEVETSSNLLYLD